MPMSPAVADTDPTVWAAHRRKGIAGRMLDAASWLTTPLQPEDYLSLVNPLWSARGLRGRVEAVHRETADAATVLIRPGRGWAVHRAGQFVRVGVEVGGACRWRSYSLSCPPRGDGRLAVTVKAQRGGLVSSHLVHRVRRGAIVGLSGPFGAFVLPDVIPERMLFLTAGSGITPVMAMLLELAGRGRLADVVLVHSAPSADRVIFGAELRAMASRRGLWLYERHTRRPGGPGRFHVNELITVCPDWSARRAWACGPQQLLDEVEQFWSRAGRTAQLSVERFMLRRESGSGAGGRVHFTRSNRQVYAACDTSLAEVGELAGVAVAGGCRTGVCRSCVARLDAGRVRDMHTGRELVAERQLIRTCVSAAVGPVELDL